MADAFALLLINGRIALILFRQHISDSMFRLRRLTPLRAPSPLGGVRFRSARRRGRRGHPGKDGGEKGTGKQNRAVVRRAPPAPEFTTALVGRPNVGKSTLFNRLVQRRSAIVSEVRGTTRDRQAGIASLGDLHVRLVDTGGLEDRETVADLETIDGQVFTQAQWAVRNSDLILFVLDAKSGVTTEDMRYAQWLRVNCTHGGDKGGKGRKGGKGEDGGVGGVFGGETVVVDAAARRPARIELIVNKCEGQRSGGGDLAVADIDLYTDCVALGLGEPLPVSAEHGDGMSGLWGCLFEYSAELEELKELTELTDVRELKGVTDVTDVTDVIDSEDEDEDEDEYEDEDDAEYTDGEEEEDVGEEEDDDDTVPDDGPPVKVAIIGRPNVGKSTLLNQMLGTDRAVVGPRPGVTRDSISEVRAT